MLCDGIRLVAAHNKHLATSTIVNPIARAMQFEVWLPVRLYHTLRGIPWHPIHPVWLHPLGWNWFHSRNLPSIPLPIHRDFIPSEATVEVMRLQQKILI